MTGDSVKKFSEYININIGQKLYNIENISIQINYDLTLKQIPNTLNTCFGIYSFIFHIKGLNCLVRHIQSLGNSLEFAVGSCRTCNTPEWDIEGVNTKG